MLGSRHIDWLIKTIKQDKNSKFTVIMMLQEFYTGYGSWQCDAPDLMVHVIKHFLTFESQLWTTTQRPQNPFKSYATQRLMCFYPGRWHSSKSVTPWSRLKYCNWVWMSLPGFSWNTLQIRPVLIVDGVFSCFLWVILWIHVMDGCENGNLLSK